MKNVVMIVAWIVWIFLISCSSLRTLETNAWHYRPLECSGQIHYLYNKYSGLCMKIECDIIVDEVDCNALKGVKVYK